MKKISVFALLSAIAFPSFAQDATITEEAIEPVIAEQTADDRCIIRDFNEIMVAGEHLQNALGDIIGKTKDVSANLKVGADRVMEMAESSQVGANQISEAMDDLAQGTVAVAESVQSISEQVSEIGNAVENITEIIPKSRGAKFHNNKGKGNRHHQKDNVSNDKISGGIMMLLCKNKGCTIDHNTAKEHKCRCDQ